MTSKLSICCFLPTLFVATNGCWQPAMSEPDSDDRSSVSECTPSGAAIALELVRSPPPRDFEVRIQGSDCPGNDCVPIDVSLGVDGTVSLTGPYGRGRARRTVSGQASPNEVQDVWLWLRGLRFDSLPAVWRGRDCVTCRPRMTFRMTADGEDHTVRFNTGCNDPTVHELMNLTALIESFCDVPGNPVPTGVSSTDMAIGIHRLAEYEYSISRAFLQVAEENARSTFFGVRLVQSESGDGLRVFGIRRRSLLGMLGFKNGDQLLSIDGHVLDNDIQATEVIHQLQGRPPNEITIRRRDEELRLTYVFRE